MQSLFIDSSSHSSRRHGTRPIRRGGVVGALILCLVVAGLIGAIGYSFWTDRSGEIDTSELISQVASRGPFDHIVLEQGEIESSSNIEVICEVKSRGSGTGGTSILWVIDEGARVKEGDKLVELDASQLEQTLKEDRIKVIAAEANVTTAKALLEQSEIARQEYLDGVFMNEERTIQNQMLIAEQDLVKAQKALESSQRLVAKGLIKSLQLDADKFAVAKARNELEAAQGQLKVLQNLTKRKMLVQFDSDIEAARAQLAAYESELEEQNAQYADTQQQIANCTITAPAAGVVVHANRYSSRGGNAEFVVEAGATVRERQELIRLPDPTKMQVKCAINESRITLVDQGMAVKIAVDAIPGLVLKGRVSKVNRYAEPSSFFSSSIKEYAVFIDVLNPPETIRTGMTAEVQIFVEQLENALQIPIQGLYEHGSSMYALVQEGPQSFRTAEVKIGATNDTMATIKEGIEEGEKVILNLRDHLSLMDLPEVLEEDNSEMREIADVDPNARRAGPPGGGRPGGGPSGGFDGPRGDGPRGDGPRGGGPGNFDGPRGGGPGNFDGPRGGGPGGGGPRGGGRRDGGFGGSADAGGPDGGGRPDPSAIADRMMQRVDTDSDGVISSDELSGADANVRDRAKDADGDGDGSITKDELTNMLQQRIGG